MNHLSTITKVVNKMSVDIRTNIVYLIKKLLNLVKFFLNITKKAKKHYLDWERIPAELNWTKKIKQNKRRKLDDELVEKKIAGFSENDDEKLNDVNFYFTSLQNFIILS